MRIAQSPDFLQSVIDHPEVRRWVTKDSELELSLPLSQVFNQGIGIEFETGGFFFHNLGDGVYEVHTLFLPGTKNAFDCCQAAAHFLFCGTDCTRIVTKVPADNIAARKLTEKMGFLPEYTRDKAYTRDGIQHDVHHYALPMDVWARRQSPAWVTAQCEALGQQAKGDRFLHRWAVVNDDYSVLET